MLRTYLYVPEEIDLQIKEIALNEKTSKAEIMRKALKKGIGQMKKKKTGSAEILLKVAEMAKKNNVKGPRDASVKIDEYLWDKYDK